MPNTQYQLAGNAPQLYERETVHTLGRPLAERMFAHVSVQAGDRVLDAACGTGIVTRVAVQRYSHLGHIVGVDLNLGMIEVARAHTPATRVPIAWRQGEMCVRYRLLMPVSRWCGVSKGCHSSRTRERPFVTYAACSCPVGALPSRSLAGPPRMTRSSLPHLPAMSVPTPPRVASHAIRCETRRPYGSSWTTRGLAPSDACSRGHATHAGVGGVRRGGDGTGPYAREVAAVEEDVRQAVGSEVSAALDAYRDGDEVVIPHRSHLVQAQVA